MNPITLFLTIVFAVVGFFVFSQAQIGVAVILWVIAVLIFFSLKMANQWERYVILRAGRLHAVKGPGLFAIIPILDAIAVVVDNGSRRRLSTPNRR